MTLDKYSGQLRALNEDYFCGHLTFEEYRKLRGDILAQMENEISMTAQPQSETEGGVLERVLAYFKPTETSEQ